MMKYHGPALSLGDLPQGLNQQHVVGFRWRRRGRRALASGPSLSFLGGSGILDDSMY